MFESLFGLGLLLAAGGAALAAYVVRSGGRTSQTTSAAPLASIELPSPTVAPLTGSTPIVVPRKIEPAAYTPGRTSREHPAFTGALQWSQADGEHLLGLASARWGVPAEILAGQCWIESRFNPRARSGAGAFGPFQFLIPTATEELRKEGYQLIPSDLQDLGLSAYLAARYLVWLRKYLGDAPVEFDELDKWRLALSGYNAGPGNVKKGVRIRSYEDGILSYARTRGFVIVADRLTREPFEGMGVA